MGGVSKFIKLISWLLVVLLTGVILDVSLNSGELSKRYLPHSVLDEVENLRRGLSSTAEEYIITEAFERYLNDPHEMFLLHNLSTGLRGRDVVSSAWNVLLWEDEHLTYDDNRTEPQFQPPSRFLSTGRGICGDYAILTSGLLIEMNYSPVYVLAIEFNDSSVGHLATAIKVNGRYLVADQHPPLMDLAAYYRHWAVYSSDSSHIASATVYVLFWKGGKIKMKKYGELTWRDFLAQDYNMTRNDIDALSQALLSTFRGKYSSLIVDPSLPSVSEGESSSGYEWISVWEGRFPGYADYYLPETRNEMAEYMLRQITSQKQLSLKLLYSRSLWVSLSMEGPDLVVTIYLAG